MLLIWWLLTRVPTMLHDARGAEARSSSCCPAQPNVSQRQSTLVSSHPDLQTLPLFWHARQPPSTGRHRTRHLRQRSHALAA